MLQDNAVCSLMYVGDVVFLRNFPFTLYAIHSGHQGREQILRHFWPPTDDEPSRSEFTAPLGLELSTGLSFDQRQAQWRIGLFWRQIHALSAKSCRSLAPNRHSSEPALLQQTKSGQAGHVGTRRSTLPHGHKKGHSSMGISRIRTYSAQANTLLRNRTVHGHLTLQIVYTSRIRMDLVQSVPRFTNDEE